MSIHQYAPGSNGSKDFMNLAKELLEILPAEASPEVVAELEAIARAEAESKGKVWSDSPEPVTPTWSAPVEETPAETPAVEAAAEAPATPEPVVAEAAPEPVVVAEAPSQTVDPLGDLMVPPVEASSFAPPVEPASEDKPVVEAPVVEAPVVEAPVVETPAVAAPVELEMPAPADMGRTYEPTSPMLATAAELAAMAPPADVVADPAPVAEDVDDKAARLGFDPYAESSAHIETAPARPEFVSPLPATPVAELRAAISSDAPTEPAPQSTVKPVPALPSVKAASMPFGERIAMAGLKPIVTSKPGERPPMPEKKGLFSKFWKR
jgi:hypothetical protein